MWYFFLVSSALYIGMHAYAFLKLRQAFGGGWWQILAIAIFATLLLTLLIRRSSIMDFLPDWAVWLLFTWTGFLLIFCSWLAINDAARLALFIVDKIGGFSWGSLLAPARSVPVVLGLSILLSAYALYAAQDIRITHLTLESAKLPPGRERIRIAAVTDMHIGRIIGPRMLTKVAGLVGQEKPDLFVSVGDLVDGDLTGRSVDSAILRDIPAPDGKLAVLGNHEVYNGLANSRAFTSKSGFTLLEERAEEHAGIIVAGINDPMVAVETGRPAVDPAAFLRKLPRDKFILLLNHRPLIKEGEIGLFDLQISGHTHGGQVWPGRIFTNLTNKYSQGLTDLDGPLGRSWLYLSNGTGFWGPPMRLWAQPEILIVDLIPVR